MENNDRMNPEGMCHRKEQEQEQEKRRGNRDKQMKQNAFFLIKRIAFRIVRKENGILYGRGQLRMELGKALPLTVETKSLLIRNLII